MITKILLTLGVIVICLWVLSSRNQPQLKTVVNSAERKRRKQLRIAAFAFMGIMVLITCTVTTALRASTSR